MNDCLFCKIINKEIPAVIVFEDDNVLAFLDIHPVNPGHTLIVPKIHSEGLLDADDKVLEEMIVATKKVAVAILRGLGYEAFNLEQNNGKIAGQVIPHLHWHIVPRTADDGLTHWPGKEYVEGEDQIIAEKIRSQIE
jgi:histidine triad (HIT) family protein